MPGDGSGVYGRWNSKRLTFKTEVTELPRIGRVKHFDIYGIGISRTVVAVINKVIFYTPEFVDSLVSTMKEADMRVK